MNPKDVRNLKPGQILHDKKVPGLHIRAYQNSKSYYLFYRTLDKQQKRPKIADIESITLAQARQIARERLYKAAKGEEAIEKNEFTVEQLWERVWLEHWNSERYQKSGWAKETAGLYHRHIVKELGSKKLCDITPMVVRQWHKNIKKPFSANRALSVLSKMITFAEQNELKPQTGNPCNLVQANPERKRKRYASPLELANLHKALQKRKGANLKAVAYIYLILYTGARPRSLDKILWKDVVEEKGFGVALFGGKTTADSGEEEMLIIPPDVYRMLLEIHRDTSIQTLTGMGMPKRLWKEVCAECQIVGLWARDLRRTFATIGFASNDLAKVGEVLNHKSMQTTLIYAALNQASRIETVSGISEKINLIIGNGK